jgi:hypothetical protein
VPARRVPRESVVVTAPLALLGLLALVPLVALHLRRRRRRQEVDSLLLWREQAAAAPVRRRAAPVPSVALLLQALVVVLVVVALARPEGDRGGDGDAGAAPAVFVLDASAWLGIGDRLAQVRRDVETDLARLPAGTPVSLVVAGAAPRLAVDGGSADAVRAALASVRPEEGVADLRAGLALAGGQLRRAGGRVTLVHMREHPRPAVRTAGVSFASVRVGGAVDDVAVEQPVPRCAIGADGGDQRGSAPVDGGQFRSDPGASGGRVRCTVFAAVRNDGGGDVRRRLTVVRDGREVASRTVTVGAGERAEVAFAAEPGASLELRLDGGDAFAGNDRATVVVPDPAGPIAVTLVSDRGREAPLARALAATAGVELTVVAPDAFDAAGAAARAGLLVLDRWLPDGGLPRARALLLVAPPRLPDGGAVGRVTGDAAVSGSATGAPLLAGVDLDALLLADGAARRTTLPPAVRAIAWSPGAPLLAAGAVDDGDGRPAPVTVIAFDPQASTLPRLPAFPILVGNVVAQARGVGGAIQGGGAAGGTDAGAPASGGGATAAPVVLRAGDGGGAAPGERREWWPWLLGGALLVLLIEWSWPAVTRRRAVAR